MADPKNMRKVGPTKSQWVADQETGEPLVPEISKQVHTSISGSIREGKNGPDRRFKKRPPLEIIDRTLESSVPGSIGTAKA